MIVVVASPTPLGSAMESLAARVETLKALLEALAPLERAARVVVVTKGARPGAASLSRSFGGRPGGATSGGAAPPESSRTSSSEDVVVVASAISAMRRATRSR